MSKTINRQDNTAARIFHDLQNLVAENERLERENREIKANHIDISRFEGSPVDISAVAALHRVTVKTVRKYVSFGLISKHPKSTESIIFISAQEVLKLNFSELMRKARVRIYNN